MAGFGAIKPANKLGARQSQIGRGERGKSGSKHFALDEERDETKQLGKWNGGGEMALIFFSTKFRRGELARASERESHPSV